MRYVRNPAVMLVGLGNPGRRRRRPAGRNPGASHVTLRQVERLRDAFGALLRDLQYKRVSRQDGVARAAALAARWRRIADEEFSSAPARAHQHQIIRLWQDAVAKAAVPQYLQANPRRVRRNGPEDRVVHDWYERLNKRPAPPTQPQGRSLEQEMAATPTIEGLLKLRRKMEYDGAFYTIPHVDAEIARRGGRAPTRSRGFDMHINPGHVRRYQVWDPVGNPGQFLLACASHIREVAADAGRAYTLSGKSTPALAGEKCPLCVEEAGVRAASARTKRARTPFGFNPQRAHRNGGSRGGINSYRVPIHEALEKFGDAPGLHEALEGFKRFHGGEPTHVEVYEYDDGSSDTHEEALFAIGKAQIEVDTMQGPGGAEVPIAPFQAGTVYSVPDNWNSDKAGKQWVHSHRENNGTPPIHAYNPVTGVMSQHGGTFYVDEWIER